MSVEMLGVCRGRTIFAGGACSSTYMHTYVTSMQKNAAERCCREFAMRAVQIGTKEATVADTCRLSPPLDEQIACGGVSIHAASCPPGILTAHYTRDVHLVRLSCTPLNFEPPRYFGASLHGHAVKRSKLC